MTLHLRSISDAGEQRPRRIPLIKDHCPAYADACKDYERAIAAKDDAAIGRAWDLVQLIATVFNQGMQAGEAFAANPVGRIRTWRAQA